MFTSVKSIAQRSNWNSTCRGCQVSFWKRYLRRLPVSCFFLEVFLGEQKQRYGMEVSLRFGGHAGIPRSTQHYPEFLCILGVGGTCGRVLWAWPGPDVATPTSLWAPASRLLWPECPGLPALQQVALLHLSTPGWLSFILTQEGGWPSKSTHAKKKKKYPCCCIFLRLSTMVAVARAPQLALSVTHWFRGSPSSQRSFPAGSDSKESSCNAGDLGLIPGLGRSPAEGNGYPLQDSCLEISMNRGAWQATVHRVTKGRTRLSD